MDSDEDDDGEEEAEEAELTDISVSDNSYLRWELLESQMEE